MIFIKLKKIQSFIFKFMINIVNEKNYLNYLLIAKNLRLGTYFVSGRNFLGRICVHHKSGGHKRNYKLIDFFRRVNAFGFIYKIIKDLNRSAYLGAILYENGLFSYIILSEGLSLYDLIFSGSIDLKKYKLNKGYALPLIYINLFTIVNNIESFPFYGSSFSRAAGTSCLLVGKKKDKIIVKFKSG